jgi:hypothetical protein
MWIKAPQTIGGIWADDTSPSKMTWEQALANCETLEFAGHNDWRLPNRRELMSIVNFGVCAPAIDQAYFPQTMSEHYWTATADSHADARAWFVYFFNGYVNINNKTSAYYVRPVRG